MPLIQLFQAVILEFPIMPRYRVFKGLKCFRTLFWRLLYEQFDKLAFEKVAFSSSRE
jgi:hypothetical protein